MVLHGIALYDLVLYVICFECFCVFRFVARAVSRKKSIPLMYLLVFVCIVCIEAILHFFEAICTCLYLLEEIPIYFRF